MFIAYLFHDVKILCDDEVNSPFIHLLLHGVVQVCTVGPRGPLSPGDANPRHNLNDSKCSQTFESTPLLGSSYFTDRTGPDRNQTLGYSTERTSTHAQVLPGKCERRRDLNEEQMATALQVSVAVLPLTKIVNLLENPPDDGISKGGELYLYKPRCDTEKGI